MSIPQLHTDLLWDLSCLTLFLTGLYFSCSFFFKSPFWKSLATTDFLSELTHLVKFRIRSQKLGKEVNSPKDPRMDRRSKKEHMGDINLEVFPGKILNDIEVEYEVLIDPIIEEQIREILESYAEGQHEKEILFYNDGEGVDTGRMGDDILDFGNIALPTAKFYSKKENERVKFLHAIAELGDVREVPLLQRMLDQERNESISLLIKEIIFGFLSERPPNKHQDLEVPKLGYISEHYVYKHLFQSIDTESQYLLLDEVFKIGGSEELNFLRTLIRHPEEGIREKARSIIDRLEEKLQLPQKDHITTGVEVAKRKRADHILRISYITKTLEKSYSQFSQLEIRKTLKMASSYLLGIGNKIGHRSMEDLHLNDKGISEVENEVFQIDFELEIPKIKEQKIGTDNGKKERPVLSRIPPLKQLIHIISYQLEGLYKKHKL